MKVRQLPQRCFTNTHDTSRITLPHRDSLSNLSNTPPLLLYHDHLTPPTPTTFCAPFISASPYTSPPARLPDHHFCNHYSRPREPILSSPPRHTKYTHSALRPHSPWRTLWPKPRLLSPPPKMTLMAREYCPLFCLHTLRGALAPFMLLLLTTQKR